MAAPLPLHQVHLEARLKATTAGELPDVRLQ
jgi:hypothetical protein